MNDHLQNIKSDNFKNDDNLSFNNKIKKKLNEKNLIIKGQIKKSNTFNIYKYYITPKSTQQEDNLFMNFEISQKKQSEETHFDLPK